MNLVPYLFFDGTCADAMQFYTEVFGGTLAPMQRWSDMPPNPEYPVSDEQKNRVMHARMDAKAVSLMASDGTPGNEQKGGNISLSLKARSSSARFRAAGQLRRRLPTCSGARSSVNSPISSASTGCSTSR
jgi:PhnB protein